MTGSQDAYRRGYDRIEWKPLSPVERKPRGTGKRADFPTPMTIRDFDDPVQSMADGKWYSSKAALARSHKASGNPHGQDFVELGNEKQEFREYTPDKATERNTIRKAIHDFNEGWRPDVLALD